MKAKEYLSQAYRLDKRINSKLDQIASLSELATKCTSTLTGLPRNPNRGGSTVADAIGNVIDLQVEINNDIDCQRQSEIVRKRRINFVVFRRGGG